MVRETIKQVAAGQSLSMDQMTAVMDVVMRGECTEEEMARLLTALHTKGESIEELAGAAASLRRHMRPIRSRHEVLIDTCGTGGDYSRTFNISTATALVTAAAGVPVAKHGNRGITSRSGSADVLAALGVNIEADLDTVQRCLDELGICFCFAPLMHPSVKNVANVRRKLATPTIFNWLGPLCNPASAPFQLMGVGRPSLGTLLAAALQLLGTRRAAVISGADGLDEVTLNGATRALLVEQQAVEEATWTPHDFGLHETTLESLLVDGPLQSAAMIREILAGTRSPARDIVVMNSAAAMWVAGHVPTLRAGSEAASRVIDDGAARQLLADLVALSRG
ncbi:MAG: anthranilate phosphoribosyltransferase [Planctomycetaceae bacterium]|nr:anthranilate phosphoribosyltransferase [Planctomycetaceae bacterium]